MTRNDKPSDANKAFLGIAKVQWLNRLSKSLPENILDRKWPPCPYVCKEASFLLETMYAAHMSRVYRYKLSPERKEQFELKVLAEKLFEGKKKPYPASVRQWFVKSRVADANEVAKAGFVSTAMNGEKEVYAFDVSKYDRHGYKPRDRTIIVTNRNLHVLEIAKGSVKPKHCLPLNRLSYVVTPGTDRMLLIRIPEESMKKDKGDLILQVPNLIEAITFMISVTQRTEQLTIIDRSP